MFSTIAGWTSDMWGPVINLFSFIPNYGFMIIVFTICLKLVLSPLDFWQKKVSRDSALKQAKLQPEMAKLQKKFGNNKQMLNQKTMELYKKENYNVVGSCLSMLLNMALTLFIFITLFTGLIEISHDKIYNQYQTLKSSYYQSYNTQFMDKYSLTDPSEISAQYESLITAKHDDALAALQTEFPDTQDFSAEQIREKSIQLLNEGDLSGIITDAQNAALLKYNEVKDSWLWVKNIWRPDTAVSGFPDFNTFSSTAALTGTADYKEATKDMSEEQKKAYLAELENEYNMVTAQVQDEYKGWNGYFILVILAALVTFLSATISQKNTLKKSQKDGAAPAPAAGAVKIMRWILPIVMVIFTIGYSAAFSMYIVTNSLMSLLLSLLSLKVFEKLDDKKAKQKEQKNKVEYSR